jgi:sec-independent protein translocase protein TatA
MGLENPTHWIPIIVVLLLVFGARRLPEIGRSLGEGMRGFRDSLTGQGQQPEKLNAGAEQAPAPQAQPVAAPVATPAPTPAQQAPAPQAPPTAEPPPAAT